MSSAAKALDNQSKHLTQAEQTARAAAEDSVRRSGPVNLKPPKGFPKPAKKYWNSILKRLQDVELLDDLDKEMLAVYCQMLVRRDSLNDLCDTLLANAVDQDNDTLNTDATDKLDSLLSKIAALERSLMTYADKLGFTPQSRVRLAQKRAAAEADPDSDYFGD